MIVHCSNNTDNTGSSSNIVVILILKSVIDSNVNAKYVTYTWYRLTSRDCRVSSKHRVDNIIYNYLSQQECQF